MDTQQRISGTQQPAANWQQLDSRHNNATSCRKRAIAIAIITLGIVGLLLWFWLTLERRIQDVESSWNSYNNEAAAHAHALAEVGYHFGYGGFIHNFKNLVLRQDPALIPVIEEKLSATYNAIDKYQGLIVHDQEGVALQQIRQTVDEYRDVFTLARQLIQEERLSKDIDAFVKVDDTTAVAALHSLNKHVLEHNKSYQAAAQKHLENARNLLNLGLLLIPLVLITGITLISFLRRLVTTNTALQATSESLRQLFEAAPDAMFMVDTEGRIEHANIQAVKLLGYRLDEFKGMAVEQLMPEHLRNGHTQLRQAAFGTQQTRPLKEGSEFTVLSKSGHEITTEIGISFTLQEQGAKAITTLRDISERKAQQDALRKSEETMNTAQRIAHIGSWDWDIVNNTLHWSDEIYRMFGLQPQEFGATYEAFLERIHPLDRDLVTRAVSESLEKDTPYDVEHHIIRPDGEERIVREQGKIYRNESGQAIRMIGTVHDITKSKRAEAELRLAENVFNHTTEAILVTDKDNRILRANKAFSEISGYSLDETLGKKPAELLKSGQHTQDFYKELWQTLIEKGNWEGEIIDRRKNGEIFYAWHNISIVKDIHGNIIQHTSIFSDITEKKRAEEHIQNLAQYDQLTKLPNRNLFNDRLTQALARARRRQKKVGLMFIDLDRFKNINDTLGHHAGDELLRTTASRLSECVREEDTVARLGGDEFTIILEDLNQTEDANIVAQKILEKLREPTTIENQNIVPGGSIGISFYPDDGETADTIIKCADIAMYQSKQGGRGRFEFYSEEFSEHASRRFHLENQLREAIEKSHLTVFYQPQIDARQNKLIGAEALVRWNDPEKGLISPADFIPLAEETGLIENIGHWVLRTACLQTKLWQDEGFAPMRISVNVAGLQISSGSIVETTRQALSESQLGAEFLELEITESFIMENPEKSIAVLHELRELGVSLAIDDFGTGYSSLSYLKQLPIDRLKIDRSFVMDIPRDKDDEAITAAIIAMSQSLGLSVIAEGVENEEQIHFLDQHGCFELQGFFYSKPVPHEEFQTQLKPRS